VVFVDQQRALHLAHVKGVEVVVFVRDCKVEGLHGVPRERIRAHLEHDLAHGRRHTHVIQRDVAVRAARCEQRLFRRVELHGCNRVGAPRKLVGRLRAARVPHLHLGAARHEEVLAPVVVNATNDTHAPW
jgi:hypothetical protein